MNCPHSDTGWCLDCVKDMHDEPVLLWESEEPHAIVKVEFTGKRCNEVWIHSDTFGCPDDAVDHAKLISRGHPLDMVLEWCYESKSVPPWIHDAAAKLLNRGSLAHGFHDDQSS